MVQRTVVRRGANAPALPASSKLHVLLSSTIPSISSFALSEIAMAENSAGNNIPFEFALRGSLGIEDRRWRSEVRIAYRDYLEDAVRQNSLTKNGIDWQHVSIFPHLDQDQILKKPVNLVLIFDRIPKISDPDFHAWLDYAADNPQAQLVVQVNHVKREELADLKRVVQEEILRIRRETKYGSEDIIKGVNVRAFSQPGEYLRWLRQVASSSPTLVYGDDRPQLKLFVPSLHSVPKREKVLLVHDDVGLLGDELKKAGAPIAALRELFSNREEPRDIISAASLFSATIGLAAQVEAIIGHSA